MRAAIRTRAMRCGEHRIGALNISYESRYAGFALIAVDRPARLCTALELPEGNR